jgi:hypothetical protein
LSDVADQSVALADEMDGLLAFREWLRAIDTLET